VRGLKIKRLIVKPTTVPIFRRIEVRMLMLIRLI
jgi:hypothetical protein